MTKAPRSRRTVQAVLLGLAVLSGGCGSGGVRTAIAPQVHASRAIAEACVTGPAQPSHFAFRSSFWLNLHNYLYQEAKRARGIRDEARSALPDSAAEITPSRMMTASERERWERAVAFYAESVVAGPHPDSVVIRVNDRLARSDSVPDLQAEPYGDGVRRALLDAAPVYREVWWPVHDARNRAWIAAMQGYLERYEPCLAGRLAVQLGGHWPEEPIRVDATVYANWFGAYTTFAPPQITISTTAAASQGVSGLESLLHEAGHVLLGPLETAIRETAAQAERAPDPALSHLLLFYTAGDLVWRAIPNHPTNAVRFGIWEQNGRARALRALIAREWRPWLDGERSMEEALRSLLVSAGAVQSE